MGCGPINSIKDHRRETSGFINHQVVVGMRPDVQRAARHGGMEVVSDVEVEVRILRTPDQVGDRAELRELGNAGLVVSPGGF
jgi:hypothetical protein